MGRQSEGIPRDPVYVPSRPKEHLIYRRAENVEVVGYTPAEYGVRKDDGGVLIKPYNRSAGLLVLSNLMSLFFGLMIYGLIQIAITHQ